MYNAEKNTWKVNKAKMLLRMMILHFIFYTAFVRTKACFKAPARVNSMITVNCISKCIIMLPEDELL